MSIPLEDPIYHDSFEQLGDYKILHEDRRQDIDIHGIQNSRIVFCTPSRLIELFDFIKQRPQITNRFILISGNDDYNITANYMARKPEQVAYWFARNLMLDPVPDQYSALPIGVNKTITNALSHINTIPEGTDLHIKFNILTNHGERDKALEWSLRNPLANRMRNGMNKHDFTREVSQKHVPAEEYLKEMCYYRYVIAPAGGGEDTYRMWEALYTNGIPVTRSTPLTRYFSNFVPIILLDLWEDIVSMDLQAEETKLNLNFDRRHLTFGFWKELVEQTTKRILG